MTPIPYQQGPRALQFSGWRLLALKHYAGYVGGAQPRLELADLKVISTTHHRKASQINLMGQAMPYRCEYRVVILMSWEHL